MNVHAQLEKPEGWHENRLKGLGGSDANIIMSGDDAALLALWETKLGKREPDNLDDVLPVQLGSFTEPFNRFWFSKTVGREVTDAGEDVHHSTFSFMRCELDGRTLTGDGQSAIFEAKHVNAFKGPDDFLTKYWPQLHHNMACAGVDRAILSLIMGNMRYEAIEVERDDAYQIALLSAEENFWRSVLSETAPVAVTPPKPAIKAERIVDMEGNNEWAAAAADWLANKDAAAAFKQSEKSIKSATPEDAKKAHGHGIEISRSKNGSLRIKEMKNADQ